MNYSWYNDAPKNCAYYVIINRIDKPLGFTSKKHKELFKFLYETR